MDKNKKVIQDRINDIAIYGEHFEGELNMLIYMINLLNEKGDKE